MQGKASQKDTCFLSLLPCCLLGRNVKFCFFVGPCIFCTQSPNALHVCASILPGACATLPPNSKPGSPEINHSKSYQIIQELKGMFWNDSLTSIRVDSTPLEWRPYPRRNKPRATPVPQWLHVHPMSMPGVIVLMCQFHGLLVGSINLLATVPCAGETNHANAEVGDWYGLIKGRWIM